MMSDASQKSPIHFLRQTKSSPFKFSSFLFGYIKPIRHSRCKEQQDEMISKPPASFVPREHEDIQSITPFFVVIYILSEHALNAGRRERR